MNSCMGPDRGSNLQPWHIETTLTNWATQLGLLLLLTTMFWRHLLCSNTNTYITNAEVIGAQVFVSFFPLRGQKLPFSLPSLLFLATIHLPPPSSNAIILGHMLYNIPYMKILSKGVAHAPSLSAFSLLHTAHKGHDSASTSCSENLLRKWTIMQIV